MISDFNIQCGYVYDHLASEIYLAPSGSIVVSVDNGDAYCSRGSGQPFQKIDAFNIKLEDTSEFSEERYQFTHSLVFSVNGYANIELADNEYYYVVKSKSNEYFVLNPNFPSKLTYTYTLDNSRSVTTFTAATASNFPVLLLTNMETLPAVTYSFDYVNTKLCSIQMNERQNVMYFEEFAVYTNEDGFSNVDFLKKSASFSERFDGENITHTLQFNIPFSERGTSVSAYSWNYNLLEFQNNKYAAVIKASDGNYFMSGFEYGLQPSFSVNATSTKEESFVTITLTEVFSSGMFSKNISNLQIIRYGDPMIRRTSGTPYCDVIMRLVTDVEVSTSTDLGATWTDSEETVVIADKSEYCSLKELPFMIYNSGNTTGSVSWNARLEMSRNNSTWTDVNANTEISIPSNQAVYFRVSYGTLVQNSFKLTTNSGNLILCGNIMSLLYRTNFADVTKISTSYIFSETFRDCTYIKEADRLILPATTLADNCYESMFQGCTSLTTAPELPAVYLATGCYDRMFYNCTNLTTAPVLNARTLVVGCYGYMFNGCSKIGVIKCYAKNLSATAMGALTNWVQGVAYLGTFYKRADVTWPTGPSGIPNGWRVRNV